MQLQFINEDTGDLKNAVFCFTGKAPKTRQVMESIAINAGATVTKTINRYTTILVAAIKIGHIVDVNDMSSKSRKAIDYEIDIISPERFFLMCDSATESNAGNRISRIRVKKPVPITRPSGKRKHSSVRRIQL